jgi:translation initiation factor IF-3
MVNGNKKPVVRRRTIKTRVTHKNDQVLKEKEVRVVYNDGDTHLVKFEKALQMAEEAGYDLVVVAEEANPPVVKIMDFGKELYRQAKAEKKNKQNAVKNKEVKFSPHIEDNDYKVKIDHIKKFLDKKMRVKVSMYFRGRDMAHKELGIEVLNRVVEDVEGVGKVDVPIKSSGRNCFLTLVPEQVMKNDGI